MEVALSYGYPVAIILFASITYLLYLSYFKIFKYIKTNFLERAWWTSAFIFLLSQLFDIQYFDGRISLLFWIILAGLKKIIDDKEIKILSRI